MRVTKINPADVKSTKGKRGRPANTYVNYVWQYTDSKTGESVTINSAINPKYCVIYGPHGEKTTHVKTNRMPYNQ